MSKNQSPLENYSPEEKQLIEEMRKNPSLKHTIAGLMQNFNAEVATGMNELEAELMITDMTRTIGFELVRDWADHTELEAIQKAQEKSPKAIKRGKKKSTGTPPSDA